MTLRANLGYILFFAFCMLLGLLLAVGGIVELVTKFSSLSFSDLFTIIFGISIGLWMFLYLFKFTFGCSIKINEESVILKNWKNKFSNLNVEKTWGISPLILPSSKINEAKIDNIELVAIASSYKLKKICREIGDEKTAKEIGSFRYKLKKAHSSRVVGTHSIRQYLYIKEKNNDSKIVDVTLFSKKRLKKLLELLEERNKNIIFYK